MGKNSSIKGDGDVDILDVQAVAYRWNTHSGDALYSPTYDVYPNGAPDGMIGILDVQTVAYRWGTRCSALTRPMFARPATTPIALSIQPYSQTVTANQIFTVSVAISDVVNLGAFEFTLAYSPTVVEVMSATIGAFPGNSNRAFTPVGLVISPTTGTVNFGAFSLGASPAGPNGNGSLAVLTLRSMAAGASGVTFVSAQVSDPAASPQPIGAMMGGQINVRPGWKVYLPLIRR